jgi:hypothetical protein
VEEVFSSFNLVASLDGVMKMKNKNGFGHKQLLLLFFVLSLFLCFTSQASATTLFFDDFEDGADAAWGNQFGDWTATDGSYISLSPLSSNPTYSSVTTLPSLTDFALDIDINNLDHGGIYLRSTSRDRAVVLILRSNGTIYWHKRYAGFWGAKLGEVTGISAMALGEDISLRIEVIGINYSVYLNGSRAAVTTLIDSAYTGGAVGLYDYSDSMTFDNIRISDFVVPEIVDLSDSVLYVVNPEPSTYLLLGSGLLGLVAWRRRQVKKG